MSRASKGVYHPHGDANNFKTTEKALDDLDTAVGTKLDASSYTAADVLAKLITVDGAGSGLDADLLDGNHGAFYSPNRRILRAPTASFTLPLTDEGNVNIMNGSGSIVCTVSSATGWTGGAQVDFINNTANSVTFAASGQTILSANSFVAMNGIYSACTLVYLGSNIWYLFGNLK